MSGVCCLMTSCLHGFVACWKADSLRAKLGISGTALRKHLNYWSNQGILREHPADTFTIVEEQEDNMPSSSHGNCSMYCVVFGNIFQECIGDSGHKAYKFHYLVSNIVSLGNNHKQRLILKLSLTVGLCDRLPIVICNNLKNIK